MYNPGCNLVAAPNKYWLAEEDRSVFVSSQVLVVVRKKGK